MGYHKVSGQSSAHCLLSWLSFDDKILSPNRMQDAVIDGSDYSSRGVTRALGTPNYAA